MPLLILLAGFGIVFKIFRRKADRRYGGETFRLPRFHASTLRQLARNEKRSADALGRFDVQAARAARSMSAKWQARAGAHMVSCAG